MSMSQSELPAICHARPRCRPIFTGEVHKLPLDDYDFRRCPICDGQLLNFMWTGPMDPHVRRPNAFCTACQSYFAYLPDASEVANEPGQP